MSSTSSPDNPTEILSVPHAEAAMLGVIIMYIFSACRNQVLQAIMLCGHVDKDFNQALVEAIAAAMDTSQCKHLVLNGSNGENLEGKPVAWGLAAMTEAFHSKGVTNIFTFTPTPDSLPPPEEGEKYADWGRSHRLALTSSQEAEEIVIWCREQGITKIGLAGQAHRLPRLLASLVWEMAQQNHFMQISCISPALDLGEITGGSQGSPACHRYKQAFDELIKVVSNKYGNLASLNQLYEYVRWMIVEPA